MDFKELYRLYGHVLTEKEKDVIELRYNVDLTIEEVSCMIGESGQKVQEIEKQARKKLLAEYNP